MATTQSLIQPASYFIYRAFRVLKHISPNETLEPFEIADALEVLQDMMRDWQVGDTPLHKRVTVDIPLLQGVEMYETGRGSVYNALDIHNVRYVSGVQNYSHQLNIMDEVTYLGFPNKTQQGTPAQYHFSRTPGALGAAIPTDLTNDATKLYIWPTATAQDVANGAVLRCLISQPYAIPQLETDAMDIPQEWYRAVVYKLAAELFDEYGGNDIVIPKAAELWAKVLDDFRPAYIDIVVAHT